ncbi:MAG: HipA family kinase [Longimicrobiales bacterium]
MTHLPVRRATRYVQPLREGGSLPAVVDTDDGLFVAKFRGAGQGAKALVAELLTGELARAAGLPVPELVLLDVASQFGRSEPDPEIQDLLRASHGLNIGMRYLDGAFNFDGMAAGELVTDEFAADLIWFDAFTTNPDRTARNPNLLVWDRQLWLIDQGAAFYAHHDWSAVDETRARSAFPNIRDHVLLARGRDLEHADERMRSRLTGEVIENALSTLPDALLLDRPGEFDTGDAARERYRRYIETRLAPPRDFAAEAIRARDERSGEPPRRLRARR